MRSLAQLFFFLAISASARAVTIWSNPITDTNPGAANPYTNGQVVVANITAQGIGRGAGVAAASTTADRYNAINWTTNAAIDSTDYFNFVLTANAGFEIDFSQFVYTGQRSGTGPTAFSFRSSADGFATDIGLPTATGATISLTGSQFQNVTGSIEFRLYGYASGGSTGTFSVNDFSFDGTVQTSSVSVPESSPGMGAFAFVFALMAAVRMGLNLKGGLSTFA